LNCLVSRPVPSGFKPPESLMNIEETIVILEALAQGINPVTGDKLVYASPFDEPLVIRALNTAAQSLRQSSTRSEQPKSFPPKAGSGWSAEEDQELIRQFRAGLPVKTIVASHQRTLGAIQSRLARLGLVEPLPRPQPLGSANETQPWWKEQGRTQTGKAWTKEEDEALLRDFRLGVSLEELVSRLKRGVNAVEVRLAKLGIRSSGDHQ
jgi:hypothetical protein